MLICSHCNFHTSASFFFNLSEIIKKIIQNFELKKSRFTNYLEEANIVSVLFKASTTDHHSVFSDDTMSTGTNTAKHKN